MCEILLDGHRLALTLAPVDLAVSSLAEKRIIILLEADVFSPEEKVRVNVLQQEVRDQVQYRWLILDAELQSFNHPPEVIATAKTTCLFSISVSIHF